MNTDKLEKLIERYTRAIWAKRPNADHIDILCGMVEAEADRINYPNHGRLAALHTQAERTQERAVSRKPLVCGVRG